MGMILRIASSRIVGQGDIVGRSGYFSLNLSANSVMRGRLDARRTLKSLVADLRISYTIKGTYGFNIYSLVYIHKPLFCYLFPINRTFRYLRYPNTEVTNPLRCFMSLSLGQSKRNAKDSASTLFREDLILFSKKINAF